MPRPVKVHSDDYVLQEYGASKRQARRAYRAVLADVRAAENAGATAGVRLGDLAAILRSLPQLSRDEAKAFDADLQAARKSTRRQKQCP